MRATEIRQLSPEELEQRLKDSADDLFRLRFQLISGQLQNHRRIREAKLERARMKTIIRERELQTNETLIKEENTPAEE